MVQQIEKQDSLVFELIYAHNHEIMPLFIRHKTFETALMKILFCFLFMKFKSIILINKPHFKRLLQRCEEFNLTELIDYFHKIGIDTAS